MDTSSRYNKYDISLFLIIVSTIYGRYGLLHPTAFLSIWFLPLLINNFFLLKTKDIKPVATFLLLWFCYALVSFTWTPQISEGLKSMYALAINTVLFLEIIVFSTKANKPVQVIMNAWFCAFLLTSVVALWEIVSGNHLLSAREESMMFIESRGDEYATVTYYNPNTYCYFMCLSFPFILYKISQSNNRGKFLRNLAVALLLIFIMLRNSSRGGLLTILLMASIYIYCKMRNSSARKKIHMFFFMIGVLLLVIAFGEVLFSTILYRLENKGMFESNVRLMLIICSWQLFIDSNYLGTGVGSMLYELEHSPLNFSNVYYAHNMIMEVLLEYGFFIALGLVCFLFRLFKKAKIINDYNIKSILFGVLISFPFYSVINSENLKPFFVWTFFASIYVFAIYQQKKILT